MASFEVFCTCHNFVPSLLPALLVSGSSLVRNRSSQGKLRTVSGVTHWRVGDVFQSALVPVSTTISPQ